MVKLFGPGGARAVVAESLLLRQQLMVLNRPRQRAPNLRPLDRIITGLCALLVHPRRIIRSTIVLKTSTVLGFHRAFVKRKYRLLFSSKRRGKPGPKGPPPEVITAIVEMKRRNPHFGCRRIAQQIALAFGIKIDKVIVRRVLFRFHRWQANLRILDITEIKTVPYTPVSHPFVERLIGTVRREYLDQILFWSAGDLERKLADFGVYYNEHRVHSSLENVTPAIRAGDRKPSDLDLNRHRWQSHCKGLYQTPIAA